MEDLSERETLKFAQGAAALTLCHENTINPNLSVENIKKVIKENYNDI